MRGGGEEQDSVGSAEGYPHLDASRKTRLNARSFCARLLETSPLVINLAGVEGRGGGTWPLVSGVLQGSKRVMIIETGICAPISR